MGNANQICSRNTTTCVICCLFFSFRLCLLPGFSHHWQRPLSPCTAIGGRWLLLILANVKCLHFDNNQLCGKILFLWVKNFFSLTTCPHPPDQGWIGTHMHTHTRVAYFIRLDSHNTHTVQNKVYGEKGKALRMKRIRDKGYRVRTHVSLLTQEYQASGTL